MMAYVKCLTDNRSPFNVNHDLASFLKYNQYRGCKIANQYKKEVLYISTNESKLLQELIWDNIQNFLSPLKLLFDI